jgi:hypothetical protein
MFFLLFYTLKRKIASALTFRILESRRRVSFVSFLLTKQEKGAPGFGHPYKSLSYHAFLTTGIQTLLL